MSPGAGEVPREDAGDGFDLLRIIAALMVIFAHSFPLAGNVEPRWHQGELNIGFGSAALAIFFVISGYLVTASWLRDPVLARFLVRRVARIWPGLIVMLVVTTWGIGVWLTTLPRLGYLTNLGTVRYFAGSALLLPVWELPGVFQSNLYRSVNGSLWTLPVEVTAYAGVVAVSTIVTTRGLPRIGLVTVAGVAAVVLAFFPAAMRATALVLLPGLPYDICFVAGAFLFVGRDRIPLRWPILGAAVLGLTLACLSGAIPLLFPCGAYAIVFLATRHMAASRAIRARGDPSYGIYIYAYPIQQVFVTLHLAGNGWVLFGEATLVTLAVAYLSWHLVESRALSYARQRLGRSRPVPAVRLLKAS